jgi:hypothetical protein
MLRGARRSGGVYCDQPAKIHVDRGVLDAQGQRIVYVVDLQAFLRACDRVFVDVP